MEQIEQSSRDVQSELPDRGDQGDFPGIDGVEAPDRDEEIDQRGSHSSSSDSEDDQDLSGGYMLLPQGIDEEETSSECPSASAEDNSPSLEIRNRTNYQEGKEEEEEEEEEVKGEEEGKGVEEEEGKGEGVEEEGATASSVANPQPVAVLENSQVEAIKQAMAGFSLPPSSIPDWAKTVPEDVWKSKLMGGLQEPASSDKKRRRK